MIDQDDLDVAWMFAVRPVRLGDPSLGQRLFAWLLSVGGTATVVHAIWYSPHGWEQLVLGIPMLLAGLHRVGATLRSVVIEADAMVLRHWGAWAVSRIQPTEIRNVSIGFHDGEKYLVLDLGNERRERVMADQAIVAWLSAHGLQVPATRNPSP